MTTPQNRARTDSDRPQEAARVAPYLTSAVRHHGQITLVPPDNAGRIRRPKNEKRPPRAERHQRSTGQDPQFNVGVRPGRRVQRSSPTRGTRRNSEQNRRDIDAGLSIPDYPPPSFDEAISTGNSYAVAPTTQSNSVTQVEYLATTRTRSRSPPSRHPEPILIAPVPPSRSRLDLPSTIHEPTSPTTEPRYSTQANRGDSDFDSDSDSDDSTEFISAAEVSEATSQFEQDRLNIHAHPGRTEHEIERRERRLLASPSIQTLRPSRPMLERPEPSASGSPSEDTDEEAMLTPSTVTTAEELDLTDSDIIPTNGYAVRTGSPKLGPKRLLHKLQGLSRGKNRTGSSSLPSSPTYGPSFGASQLSLGLFTRPGSPSTKTPSPLREDTSVAKRLFGHRKFKSADSLEEVKEPMDNWEILDAPPSSDESSSFRGAVRQTDTSTSLLKAGRRRPPPPPILTPIANASSLQLGASLSPPSPSPVHKLKLSPSRIWARARRSPPTPVTTHDVKSVDARSPSPSSELSSMPHRTSSPTSLQTSIAFPSAVTPTARTFVKPPSPLPFLHRPLHLQAPTSTSTTSSISPSPSLSPNARRQQPSPSPRRIIQDSIEDVLSRSKASSQPIVFPRKLSLAANEPSLGSLTLATSSSPAGSLHPYSPSPPAAIITLVPESLPSVASQTPGTAPPPAALALESPTFATPSSLWRRSVPSALSPLATELSPRSQKLRLTIADEESLIELYDHSPVVTNNSELRLLYMPTEEEDIPSGSVADLGRASGSDKSSAYAFDGDIEDTDRFPPQVDLALGASEHVLFPEASSSWDSSGGHHYSGRPLPRPPGVVSDATILPIPLDVFIALGSEDDHETTHLPAYDASATVHQGNEARSREYAREKRKERAIGITSNAATLGTRSMPPLNAHTAHTEDALVSLSVATHHEMSTSPSAAIPTLRVSPPPHTSLPRSVSPGPSSSSLLAPASPITRTSSTGSSVTLAADETRAPLSEYTDLDALIARLDQDGASGNHYEDMLRLSEIIGDARPRRTLSRTDFFVPSGVVREERRRVLSDGRAKIKLTLLGARVDKCGICLSQFKHGECGCLGVKCRHAFHEVCVERWLTRAETCPVCRERLGNELPQAAKARSRMA